MSTPDCPNCEHEQPRLDKVTDEYRFHVSMEKVGVIKEGVVYDGPDVCLYQCPRCKKVIIN